MFFSDRNMTKLNADWYKSLYLFVLSIYFICVHLAISHSLSKTLNVGIMLCHRSSSAATVVVSTKPDPAESRSLPVGPPVFLPRPRRPNYSNGPAHTRRLTTAPQRTTNCQTHPCRWIMSELWCTLRIINASLISLEAWKPQLILCVSDK